MYSNELTMYYTTHRKQFLITPFDLDNDVISVFHYMITVKKIINNIIAMYGNLENMKLSVKYPNTLFFFVKKCFKLILYHNVSK